MNRNLTALITLVGSLTFLSGCSESFKYQRGACIQNNDRTASWFGEHAVVEGFGNIASDQPMDAYALSFPSYRSETVFLKEITSIELPHWLVRAFATLISGRKEASVRLNW